jgi:ABC-type spermidine/putrescine transport system permease subunit II
MTPEINAVSTIIFVFSLFTIIVWYRIRTRGEAQQLAASMIQGEIA